MVAFLDFENDAWQVAEERTWDVEDKYASFVEVVLDSCCRELVTHFCCKLRRGNTTCWLMYVVANNIIVVATFLWHKENGEFKSLQKRSYEDKVHNYLEEDKHLME